MKNGILLSTRITEISIIFTQSFNWSIVCIIGTHYLPSIVTQIKFWIWYLMRSIYNATRNNCVCIHM